MNLIPSLMGFAVFFGCIYWAWSSKAVHWRELAAQYPERGASPARAELSMQTLIMLRRGALNFHGHTGIISVRVTDTGLGLRVMLPFSWMHAPIHIPFTELTAEASDWYLNTSSFDLITSRAPRIRTVITGELLDWISEHAPEWRAPAPRVVKGATPAILRGTAQNF